MTGALELGGHRSREAFRAHLRDWLGTDAPIDDAVLAALMVSPRYAQMLGSVRAHPHAVAHLLGRPPKAPLSVLDRIGRDDAPAGTAGAFAKAGASALRWAGEGLRPVDEVTRARRWAACRACPHLSEPPARPAYRLAARIARDARICGLCGCNVRIKGRFPHERCPDPDPADPGRSRWGEPVPNPVEEENAR